LSFQPDPAGSVGPDYSPLRGDDPVALVSFPISIGIAIVRYRRYEIDTLINRTLVYGALTAALVALYFGEMRWCQVSAAAICPLSWNA